MNWDPYQSATGAAPSSALYKPPDPSYKADDRNRFYTKCQLGVDRLSAWPIIGADIKHFTEQLLQLLLRIITQYAISSMF